MDRASVEDELRARLREQEAVLGLGRRALQGIALPALLDEAVRLVAGALGVELAEILELSPARDALWPQAAAGWRASPVDAGPMPVTPGSLADAALGAPRPLVVDSLAADPRFAVPPRLLDHGVVAGLVAVVPGRERPFGLLGAYATRSRRFSHDDVRFVEAVVGLLATVIERERVEQDVRGRDKLIRAVLAATEDAVFVKIRDGRYVMLNEAGCRAIGRPLDDILGRDDAELFPPETASLIRSHDRAVIESGESRRFELTLVRPDGTPAIYVSTKSPFRDADGRIIGVIGVSRDVTESRRAEEARERLLAAERRARANAEGLLLVARDVVQSLDPLPLGQRIADTVCTLLGGTVAVVYTRETETGALVALARAGALAHRLDGPFSLPRGAGLVGLAVEQRAALTTRDLLADDRVAYPPEERRRVERTGHRAACAIPLMVHDRVIGALGIGDVLGRVFDRDAVRLGEGFADLAALALANAEAFAREQARRVDAQAANRSKDEFLAMLGHELRNPLGAITSAAAVLGRLAPAHGDLRRVQEVIARQAGHLARLVDDLLDVARATRGKIVLSRQALDLGALVARSLAALTEGPGPAVARITSRMGAPCWVDGDETRLDQVVSNLLENAVKYTPPSGRIEVTVTAEDDEAVLRVRDTGAGIRPELLPHIFDPFTQEAQTLDRARGGLGLGLALVRQMVELHGGSVAAHSGGPGTGSEFVVRLPRLPAAPVPPALPAAPAPGVPGLRILVVEDHEDARQTLQMLLERQGHVVEAVGTGVEALDRLRGLDLDVALVDLGLPGLDGYEVARGVRAMPGGEAVRLVAITGYGQAEDRRRTAAAGFDGHLVKPFTLAGLTETLAALSAGARAAGH